MSEWVCIFVAFDSFYIDGDVGHTACLYEGDKLVVFGGENEHREYLSDVVILDLKTATWTSPDIRGHVPRGRTRHASVIYQDKLFVVGGIAGETKPILDDLCYLDLKTWTWSRSWSFVARFDHTIWVWGSRLWVFGGLGIDMDRRTDLCWLDLKGSSAFGVSSSQGIVESQTIPAVTHKLGLPFNSLPLQGRSSYAANSGSVQVRTASRRNPVAPGTSSSVQFHPGAHVPDFSGTHFHIYSSGLLLDLGSPTDSVRPWDCYLSSLDLDSLRWQRLVQGSEIFKHGYRWHYCTVNEDGTKAWLLGCHLDIAPGLGDENHLSGVLSIDLTKYGVVGNELMIQASEKNRILTAEKQSLGYCSGLGADLVSVFDQPPETGSGTDFIITAEEDDYDEFSDVGDTVIVSNSEPRQTFLSEMPTSPPIHVHKIILQTRWPHFRRLYAAQMSEYHTKRMHIHEPYSVVRAFLCYLYTDSIYGHPECYIDIYQAAGMLVMANLYDMPRLRLLCVNRLSRELDVENAAVIFERASRTNEDWLRRRASAFCLTNWGRIVRTEGFQNLTKENLIELCQVADTDSRVAQGIELELLDPRDGIVGVGSKRYRTTSTFGQGDFPEEIDDDDDTMEIA